MAGLVDTLYTYKFIKILSSKWEDTDAYKQGIVDEDGTILKKLKDLTTESEKSAYTPFHRLVFKLKRMLEKVPGGKSATARYGAAIALIKESQMPYLEDALMKYLNEESTNTTGGIDNPEKPIPKKRKKKYEEEEEVVYQVIGEAVIRVTLNEDGGRTKHMKIRVRDGKKQRRMEADTSGRYTRTGNRKLRGAELVRKRRSLRKAIRKAHTSAAETKRRRSKRKLAKFVH